jgi:hypothetical protein
MACGVGLPGMGAISSNVGITGKRLCKAYRELMTAWSTAAHDELRKCFFRTNTSKGLLQKPTSHDILVNKSHTAQSVYHLKIGGI